MAWTGKRSWAGNSWSGSTWHTNHYGGGNFEGWDARSSKWQKTETDDLGRGSEHTSTWSEPASSGHPSSSSTAIVYDADPPVKRAAPKRVRTLRALSTLRPEEIPEDLLQCRAALQSLEEQARMVTAKDAAAQELYRKKIEEIRKVMCEVLIEHDIFEAPAEDTPAPAQTQEQDKILLHFDGFLRHPHLNTYLNPKHDILVNGERTYWTPDEEFFMYWLAAEARWQFCPRWDNVAEGCFDLLADVQGGKSIAIAYEDAANGCWIETSSGCPEPFANFEVVMDQMPLRGTPMQVENFENQESGTAFMAGEGSNAGSTHDAGQNPSGIPMQDENCENRESDTAFMAESNSNAGSTHNAGQNTWSHDAGQNTWSPWGGSNAWKRGADRWSKYDQWDDEHSWHGVQNGRQKAEASSQGKHEEWSEPSTTTAWCEARQETSEENTREAESASQRISEDLLETKSKTDWSEAGQEPSKEGSWDAEKSSQGNLEVLPTPSDSNTGSCEAGQKTSEETQAACGEDASAQSYLQRDHEESVLEKHDSAGVSVTDTVSGKMDEPVDPSLPVKVCVDVPSFSEDAKGTPKDWNFHQAVRYWSRRTSKMPQFWPVAGATVDIGKMIHFLSLRPGPDGRPVSDYIGQPEPRDAGWFCCPWNEFDDASLPKDTLGKWGAEADWQRAWHGCKLEGLYSIMYHGKLFASRSAALGERFSGVAPGVYVHKDVTAAKAGNYTRFVPLCKDGVCWAAKWELRVDRSDRVPVGNYGTDQWVQEERSVRLAALWLCGRRYEDLADGEEVSEQWDPTMEANPLVTLVASAAEEAIVTNETTSVE